MNKWKNPGLTDEQHMTILGFGAASPGYWADVVSLQQARLRAWQEEIAAHVDLARSGGQPIPTAYGGDARITIPYLLGVDAHYLLYAADHALTICKRYQSLSGNDPEICRVVSHFEASFGVAALRDLLAHFEEYAVGSGKTQPGVQLDGPHVDLDEEDLRGEITFRVGSSSVRIHALAVDVQHMATVCERAWLEHTTNE